MSTDLAVQVEPELDLDDDDIRELAGANLLPLPRRSELNHTDLGNAERLAAWGLGWLRHVHGVGWLYWENTRWRRDPSEAAVYGVAKFMVRDIYHERAWLAEQASSSTDDSERERWDRKAEAAGRHARRSEHVARINAAIELAQHEEALVITGADGNDAAARLDANPTLLNLRNGTLDLNTFRLKDHDREDLITNVTNASYDPAATCPAWNEFLEMVLPDPETRAYVQKAVGYSLMGSYSEYLFVPYGAGANGKSTFLWALRDVLGEYASALPAELLTPRRGGLDAGAYSSLAKLRGVRLVTTVETEQGNELAESFVKELTGEGVLQAKFMRQDMIEFENRTAVWLATNHLPVIRGNDYAIWRRLRLIPFNVTIPEDRRAAPADVQAQLRAERDGILHWAVEGLHRWRETGLDTPPAVTAATAQWQRESDPLAEWITDCCELDAGFMHPVASVRESYEQYARATGRFLLGPQRFNDRLRRLGCQQIQARYLGNNTKVWRGLRIRIP